MDAQINLPITYNQLFQLVKKLPTVEKQRLLTSLIKESFSKPGDDTIMTHFASEKALAKDWLSLEEDQAWKDL
jgi:hypothetical protein